MKYFIIALLSIVYLTCSYSTLDTTVKIGGLFFNDEMDLVHAFETAINDINELESNVRLEAVMHFLSEDDSIILQKLTCELIESGVSAIFGPSSKASSDIVEILCNSTGIPHLQFDWHKEETLRHRHNHQMTVNLAPDELMLATAYYDTLHNKHFDWKSFTIVYESEASFSHMQQLFANKMFSKTLGIKIVKFNRGEDYRILWKNIKTTREKYVLLDCPADIVADVVNASVFYNMTGQFNHLFLTNLDTHASNLTLLYSKDFRVNIAAVRLRTYMPPPVHDEIDVFEKEQEDKIITTRTMLLYDAVILFFRTLHVFMLNDEFSPPQLSCSPGNFWETGPDFLQQMKQFRPKKTQPQYKTQRLQLNELGERDDFNLEIYNPMLDRVDYVWNKENALVSYDKITENTTKRERKNRPTAAVDFSQKRPNYVVATRVGKPYFMFRYEPEGVHYEGNERFEGYAVDLIYKLAENLEFDFKFEPVPDNLYGDYDPKTGEWNGIIKQVMDNNAQLGICDLTITQQRRTVVDFTVPFMQLGVSILHFRTPPPSANLFAFLYHYSLDVWVYHIAMMITSAICFLLIARMSQTEWEPPELNEDNVLVQENPWSFLNIIRFVVGCNLNAGCEYLPRGVPMRILCATMWVFAMVLSQTYIAQLTAVTNASKMDNPVNDLNDLMKQNKIKFGTIKGGSTSKLFSESNETDYRMAWDKIKNFKPEAFTTSNELGVDRVKHDKGKYAFLMETTTLQYNMVRDCNLTQIGKPFGEKHYGIAMPLNAPYRSNMSVGILKLSEKGELYKLKQKWFYNHTEKCDESIFAVSDSNFESVRGVFYTLAAGLIFSVIVGIFEFLWNVERIAAAEKISFMTALKPELIFFLKLWLQHKPLRTYKASNRDSTSTGYSSIDKTTTSRSIVKKKKNSRKKKAKEETLKCF